MSRTKDVKLDRQAHTRENASDLGEIHRGSEARQKRREAVIHNNRGVACANKGDYDRAIADLSKSLAFKPDYAIAYYNRAEAWLHLGQWEKAKLDLTVAVAMGINMINGFRNEYASVPDFERRNGVKLPADIAAMLL